MDKKDKKSWLEVKNPKAWLFLGTMGLLYLAFGMYVIFRVRFNDLFSLIGQEVPEWLRVDFSISIALLNLVSIYFGPIVGCISAMIGIAIDYFVIGEVSGVAVYAIGMLLTQVIYGFAIYKRKIRFGCILLTNLIITLFINIPYEIFKVKSFETIHTILLSQALKFIIVAVFIYMFVATVDFVNVYFEKKNIWKFIKGIPGTFKDSFVDLGIRFSSSAAELTNVKTLVVCALMLALGTILGMFFSFKIDDTHVVGISVIAPQLVSMLYGPVVGGIVGAAGDILDCILFPKGAFFPGYTLNAFLGQVIYGMVLYKKKFSLSRVIVSKIFVALLVNLPLGTLWSWMFMDQAYIYILGTKILQQAIQIPALGILFYMFVMALQKAKVFQQLKKK